MIDEFVDLYLDFLPPARYPYNISPRQIKTSTAYRAHNLKIKLRGAGIRVVYKLVKTESQMLIIVIGVREDEEVYEIAHSRRTKHNL